MAFGLVLGGGGVVGIAWEIGVLDALAQAGALDAGLEAGRRDGEAAAVGIRSLLAG